MKNPPPNPPSLDLVFRAFCDRTRLRILYLLQSGECCVGDLVAILGIEQPSASRHLAYLRKSGLVSVRNAGQWKYYSLAPATMPFHQKMLECLACCFSEVPELQADQTRAQEIRGVGGCCPGEEQPQNRKAQKQAKRRAGSDCCES